jgi:hypothetical protein
LAGRVERTSFWGAEVSDLGCLDGNAGMPDPDNVAGAASRGRL